MSCDHGPDFRPGRLTVKEYKLRSALCTSQQVCKLKDSPDFVRWCQKLDVRQRPCKQNRQKARKLSQCVVAVALLLLGYCLAKPQVSMLSNSQLWFTLLNFQDRPGEGRCLT